MPELDDPHADAERALAEGSWELARERYEKALELQPERSAESLEGLGWVGWWLGQPQLTFESREAAFRMYREAGRSLDAARVAALLAADYREFQGESAIGRGWLERARRLGEEQPESAAFGMVLSIEADFALAVDGDPVQAVAISDESIELGRRLDSADLEAIGLAQKGTGLVALGEVDSGLRALDEALTIATHEQLEFPFTLGWSICCMISACELVGDFKRATEWCDRAREFIEEWGGRQLLGVCRSSYGNVLATYGDWRAAEGELTGAVEDLTTARPGMAPGGIVRLAELRIRQGRLQEARELLEQAGPRGTVARGELAMVEGDSATAAELAARALRQTPDDALLSRLPALELCARAEAECGRLDTAAEAVEELTKAGESVGTPYVKARVCRARGRLALAGGELDLARECLEDAIDSFTDASAPYDAAITRVELARTLAALGRGDAGERELASARVVFEELGAAGDMERASEPLSRQGMASADRTVATTGGMDRALAEVPGADELTERELEVLRLVADGLGDGEIAEKLVLSPHTIHRHVANVRAKLGAGSRAAAVSAASRAGLL